LADDRQPTTNDVLFATTNHALQTTSLDTQTPAPSSDRRHKSRKIY